MKVAGVQNASPDTLLAPAQLPNWLHVPTPASEPPADDYQQTCMRLEADLAPLKVCPTLPDRTGRFSFTLLDRYGRLLYRSPALRQAQYRDPEMLGGIVSAARLVAHQAGFGFPAWGMKEGACPMHDLPARQLPCASCRLLQCKA